MARKKLTPKKKPKRAPPAKLKNTKKANAKRGHDASFQQRMEICVLAARGASIREIVESLGCTKDMAVRWSKRSEEVMKTGSVESKRKKNVGRKPIYSTRKKKKKLYKKLKNSSQSKLARKLGHCRKVSNFISDI